MSANSYRKSNLGTCCKMYQPKTISSDMLIPDGKYLVYGANGVIGRYSEYNHTERELLMTCRGATCGTINVSEPYSWINGNAMVIHPIDDELDFDYLKYQLQSLDLTDVITGAAQPQITRQSLNPVPIIIPPKEVQKRVVSELDLISSIINKNSQQICDFNLLAASIYNEMFGSLENNPNNWQVKKLRDICSFYRGLTYAKPDEVVNSNNVVLRSNNVDLDTHSLDLEEELKYLREDLVIPVEKKVHKGTILMCMSNGSRKHVGKVAFIDQDYNYAFGGFMGLLKPHTAYSPRFIFYTLLSSDFKRFLNRIGEGIGILNLKFSTLGDFEIPIPPKALQDKFSQRIESIEKQIERVRYANRDLQTLFKSRIDAWFN